VAHPDWNAALAPFQDARGANLALGTGQEERFFNKVEDDVTRIVQQEKKREQYTNSHGPEATTTTEHEPVRRRAETCRHVRVFWHRRNRRSCNCIYNVYVWLIKNAISLQESWENSEFLEIRLEANIDVHFC